MEKLKAFIPACITFGPLFMIQGISSMSFSERWFSLVGVFMLAVGLALIFRMIVEQDKKIEQLMCEGKEQ